MSIVVDVSAERVRSPLARESIARIACRVLRAERVSDAIVSVTLVGRRAIARINKVHLGHSGPTDVISFGFIRATPADPIVGDIYICPPVARDNARMRHVGVRAEIARLTIHGVLHIVGYEHPDDGQREHSAMWRRQERLVRRVGTGAAR